MRLFIVMVLFASSLFSTTIYDMFDREVQIKDTKKIVCLGPGALRLITYLELQDRLVGVEKLELKFDINAPYRAALDKQFIKSLPVVGQGGAGKMPNLESLITLKPDIIFTSFLSKEQVELIEKKSKAPVVALSYGATYGGGTKDSKLQSIKDSIKLIGDIMSEEERAAKLVDFMDKEEKALASLKLASKKIYIGGVGYKGIQGITSTESEYPPFELLGLDNDILQGKSGHLFINKEALLAYNPDIIFLDSLGKKIVQEELETSKNIYDNMKAFKEEKVYWLTPYNFYNTNIENVYFNSWLIGSYWGKNLDIAATKKRIYSFFLGGNAFLELENL